MYHRRPLLHRQAPPGVVAKGRPGRRNGAIDVGGLGFGNGGKNGAVTGVVGIERRAVGGCDPLPADEQPDRIALEELRHVGKQ